MQRETSEGLELTYGMTVVMFKKKCNVAPGEEYLEGKQERKKEGH